MTKSAYARDRRLCLRLLSGGLIGLWLPALKGQAGQASTNAANSRYLAARRRVGHFEAVVIDGESGNDLHVITLPGRGHGFAVDFQRNRAVAFARQPGFFAVGFDLDGATQPCVFAPVEGRHFFGHGTYVDGGRLLIASENDYDAGRGVLGVHDATPGGNYRRIGEFDTGGIGSHEVIALPDDRTLCVANGGILTHPDYGKLALNLDSMTPSLAYIDARRGDLLETVGLPASLHRLSIRHLSLDRFGTVWFGCQYMGAAADRPALVGRHRRGQAVELYPGSEDVLHGLNNYIGSVSADASGSIIATSSPVGGLVAYWDAASGRCLGTTAIPDGCGVAPMPKGGFLLSSGHGALLNVAPSGESRVLRESEQGVAWDNHSRSLVPA